jgi:hypothetical protein
MVLDVVHALHQRAVEVALAAGVEEAGDAAHVKACRVHAIVNLSHALRCDANGMGKIVCEIPGKRYVMFHERAVEPPYPLVFLVAAVEIADVAAMLAMDAHRYPCRPSRYRDFERGQISCMDNGRLKCSEQSVKFWVNPECVPGGLV